MNLEELSKRKVKYARLFEDRIFPDAEIYEFELENGLYGIHVNSGGNENLVMVPTLGRHTHDERLSAFFSCPAMGFNTTVFHYTGTYNSYNKGEFLPFLEKEKKMSVQKDLSDIIDSIHPDENLSLFSPCFGGAVAIAEAAERPTKVKNVFLFAPMLYGSGKSPYRDELDKGISLGQALSQENLPSREYGPYNGTCKKGWLENIWIPMVEGKSSLSYPGYIEKLATSNVKIYGIAAVSDNLISSNTLRYFAQEYLSIPGHNEKSFFYLIDDDCQAGNKNHYGHYAIEFAPGAVKSFFLFIGKDPSEGIARKRSSDIDFCMNAKDKIKNSFILDFIHRSAVQNYTEDNSHLIELVAKKEKKEFALDRLICGLIL